MSSGASVYSMITLFASIAENEIPQLLQCLSAKEKTYPKNTYLYHAGEQVHSIGIVLTGQIHILQEDYWGNRNIVAVAQPGEMFAESYACLSGTQLGVSIFALEASTVLYLDIQKILPLCDTACSYHARLIRNLLSAIAEKNLLINRKLSYLMQRTTRQKILAYLSTEAQRQRKNDFFISFDRQQLADYLSVDRSALSAELSKLKAENFIEYHKNHFILK